MKTRTDLCLICEHWNHNSDQTPNPSTLAECRFNPPVLIWPIPQMDPESRKERRIWPRTYGGDWCGRFVKK